MDLTLRASAKTCLQTRSPNCKPIAHMSIRISRTFTTSAHLKTTQQRQFMFTWLKSQGKAFRDPRPNSTNYLGAYDLKKGQLKQSPTEGATDLVPFPLNRFFRSQPVVSEDFREAIWEKVMKEGLSVSAVSSMFGVEMSRVGAIVRLKEVEKEWIRTNKPLSIAYSKAVMNMLPQTHYNPRTNTEDTIQPHEPINDLEVHAATTQQIFYPTSESRHFTRVDAAKVFDEALLPADQRVPHPELTELEADRLSGLSVKAREVKAVERNEAAQRRRLAAEERRQAKERKEVKIISGARWDFKFREISVDAAGANGRGRNATGWRYGVPLMDRRKGEVKIPTRVE